MKNHIVRDRYGYWLEIEALSPDEAVRTSSNLAETANLDYATTAYVELASKISDKEFEQHNCAVAMDIGDMHCQCGRHE